VAVAAYVSAVLAVIRGLRALRVGLLHDTDAATGATDGAVAVAAYVSAVLAVIRGLRALRVGLSHDTDAATEATDGWRDQGIAE